LLATTALAGNEDEFFVGNDAALRAGAVVATVNDGGALWYNPGGLGGVTRNQLDMTTSVYSLRLYQASGFMRSAQGANEDLSVSEFITAPIQISYVRPLTPGVTLGLGYFSPRASKLLLRERLNAPAAPYNSDWVADITSTSADYAFGAGVGFVASRDLRMGAGLMLRWESLTEQLDFMGTVDLNGDFVQIVQVGTLLTQNVIGVEPVAGLQWDATENLTVGVNVRGPRVSVVNSGEQSNRVTVADQFTGLLAADTELEDVSKTPVSIVRWGRYYAGLAYDWDVNSLSFDADFQGKLVNDDAGVRRKLQWNARIGYSRELSKVVTAGCGMFTDRGVDEMGDHSLFVPGTNFYGGTLGMQLSNEHLLAESEDADTIVFSSVFALRYAFANTETEALVLDASQVEPLDMLQIARTDLTVHEIGLYVGSGLHF
jgi:opacity protein-like surface antigen